MKKVILVVLIMVFMLALATTAFAHPAPPNAPTTGGSCHMGASWWESPDPGPGNANGVQDGQRGMYHVHTKDNPNGYTNGAAHMDAITAAHGCPAP